MDFVVPSSLSYQTLISRRRSSVASDKSFPESVPSSPIEGREPALKYVFTCEK
ncbi:hypothetical protein GGF48_001670, partial [Coemansia sp. RSA 921]